MPDTSPLAAAAAKVGDRWILLVVEALMGGARRFGELQSVIPGIATSVLSQRLKHLENEGVVLSRPYSRRPPRFEYSLTVAGQELRDALALLAAWGAAHADEAQPPAHRLCGTALEVRWYCPTCDSMVGDVEADELRYA